VRPFGCLLRHRLKGRRRRHFARVVIRACCGYALKRTPHSRARYQFDERSDFRSHAEDPWSAGARLVVTPAP
jgi:hypothetical protein